uniref:Titin n=1 Tax=Parastrongyloides trichosuri TaxID=131310 RepID=A0A0N4ZQ49_PARTI
MMKGDNISTTTLSTIAINAKNNATIVLAMLKSVDYISLRVTSMNPPILELGENLGNCTTLHEMHKDLMKRLTSKQDQVDELLSRADQLVVEQKDTDIYVYEAMAKSLAVAWKELLRRLEMRGYLLKDAVSFYQMIGNHEELCEQIKGMLKGRNRRQLNDAMNEIVDLTCDAVDLGSWIITQIRTLGALSDDEDSFKDILKSCLLIEKNMLNLTANWELVGELKRRYQEEEEKLEKMIPIQIEKSREPPKIKDLEDEISEIEKWFNRTEVAFQKNPNIASDLIPEIKSQRKSLNKIIGFIDCEPQYYHLTPRVTNLMMSIESFLRLLENNQKGHKKFNQFINACDMLLHQLDNMITDLRDSTPAMAGELAPLARSKVKALLEFGNELIKGHIEDEVVSRKCNELQRKLSQIELMADRIILGQNDRYNNEIDRINKWMHDHGEVFLRSHQTLGIDSNESSKFLLEHENFGRELMSKQHEINAIANKMNANPPDDEVIVNKFLKLQNDFEKLSRYIENRIRLGCSYNQVKKFGRDLDASFNTLVNLLNEERNFNDSNVATRMVNVFHVIQETLTQERHHANKFITDIEKFGDEFMDKLQAKEQMYKMQESHFNKFKEITNAWEDWQKERSKVIEATSTFEEIQCWQEETIELIKILEDKIKNITKEEDIKIIEDGFEKLEKMMPEIKEKIERIVDVKSEVVNQIIDKERFIEEKKEMIKKRLEVIKEQEEVAEGQISIIKPPQSSLTEVVIDEAEEICEWQSVAYNQIQAIKEEIMKDISNKVQFGKIENVIYNVEKALPKIKEKIEKIVKDKDVKDEVLDRIEQMQNIIEEETTFILEEVYRIKINDDGTENIQLKETIKEIKEIQDEAMIQIEEAKHEMTKDITDIHVTKVEDVVVRIGKALPRVNEKLNVVFTKIPPRTPQVCKLIENQKVIEECIHEIVTEVDRVKKRVPQVNVEQTIEEVNWVHQEHMEKPQVKRTPEVNVEETIEESNWVHREHMEQPQVKRIPHVNVDQTIEESSLVHKETMEASESIREPISKVSVEEIEWVQKELLENIDIIKPSIAKITSEEEISRIENFVLKAETAISQIKPKIEVMKAHISTTNPQIAKLIEIQKVIEEETIIIKEELEKAKFVLQRDVEKIVEEVALIQNEVIQSMEKIKPTIVEITKEEELKKVEDIIIKAEEAVSYTKPKIEITISKIPSSRKQFAKLIQYQEQIEEETRIIKEEVQKIRVSIPIKKIITEVTSWQVDTLTKIDDIKKELPKVSTKDHALKLYDAINGIDNEIPKYQGKIVSLPSVINAEIIEVKERQKIIEEETIILKEDFQKIILNIENEEKSLRERKKSIVEEISRLQDKCIEKVEEMKKKIRLIETEEHVKQFEEILLRVKDDALKEIPEKINSIIQKAPEDMIEIGGIMKKQRVIEEEIQVIEEEFMKICLSIPKEITIATKILEEVSCWQIETIEILNLVKDKVKKITKEDEITSIENDIYEIEIKSPVIQEKINEAISHSMEPSILLNDVIHRQKVIEEETSIILNEIEIIKKKMNEDRKKITVDEVYIVEDVEEKIYLKPTILTPLNDIEANEGSKVDISASISGSPQPIVKWKKNGKEINESKDIKMSMDKNVATLTITEVFITDSAVYTLAIENSLGNDESSATLLVKTNRDGKEKSPDSLKPIFEKELKSTTVEEGEIVILDCIVKAKPEPEIIWYKEEVLIREDYRISLRYIGDHCTLTIRNCCFEDSGLYKCLARNVNGETTNFCRVTVHKKNRSIPPKTPPKPKSFILPTPPAFVPSLVNVTVEENEKAEFFVKVSGDPEPQLEWKFEDQPILVNNRVKIIGDEDGWSRLIIENVIPSDVGLYTITAYNEVGEARSGATLNIKPKENGIIQKETIQDIEGKKTYEIGNELIARTKQFINDHGGYWTDGGFTGTPTPPPVPKHRINQIVTEDYGEIEYTEVGLSPTATVPEFIKPLPSEVTINEGEETTVECMMVGNPRPKIEWFFNNNRIGSYDKSLEIKCSGDTYSLIFKNPSPNLSGFYKMVATNLKGTGESATVIHIRPKSLIPTATKNHSRPAFWRQCNGSQDKGGELYKNVLKSSDYSNKYCSTDDSISISKNESTGQSPHFSQTLSSTVTSIGDSAVFEGTVTGWPVPEIIWHKDGVLLDESQSPHIVSSYIGSKVRLSFRKTSPNDSAKYTCTAKNAFGLATSSAQLVVRPKTVAPDFLKRLISEEAIKGQPLKWQVKITGDPEPQVTWLINGVELKNGENGFFVEYEGNCTYTMIIPEVNASHGGQYTCLAENIAGEARSTADLVVRNADQAPGSYFHVTKVMEGTKIGNEEISKNEVFSIETPKKNYEI